MSRQFDTSGGADSITFSAGGAPPDQGPFTIAVLAKANSVAGFTMWMARASKTGTAVWGMLTSNNAGPKLFAENDFGNGVAGLSTSWRWYVMTKAAGNVPPRIHVWDLSGAWSHTDNSANVGDGTGPIDTIFVGANGSGSNGWRGSIACMVTWASALSDGAVEAAMTLAALDAFNATPAWMIRLNQASTATSVTDDTGGGGNQSAISGTSVDADDPPGFNYSLSAPVKDIDAAVTVTATGAAAATVTRPVTVAVTVTATGAAAATVQPGSGAAATVTATGAAAATVTHDANAAGHMTVAGAAAFEQPAAPVLQGNWNSLLSIYRQNATDTRQFLTQPITECPNHFEPLETSLAHPGVLHCRFGGEFFDQHGNPAFVG